jgi:ABC-type branched-subunit amino acid transport system ATPase component
MTALACSGVRKTYGAFVALNDVAMSVEPGEILGLAGPNGAGKTTLFDVLSGRVKPDNGTVTLGERDVTSLTTHGRARIGLARTFQAPLVPTLLTVGETLRSARDAYTPRVTDDQVAYARALVSLQAPDSALAGGLDTLERRKLLLACLLQRPISVLLMDEPCSGLLADEIDEIDAVIRRVVEERGCAVVVVEHRLELLFAIAKRVVVLDAGAVIAEGPTGEVFELPAVRKAYFDDHGAGA